MAFGDILKQIVPRQRGRGFETILGKPKPITPMGGFGNVLLKPNLETSEGLYNLTKQSGLQEKADKVLAEKGEEVKTLFSGGIFSDIIDALNVFQYGVVGVLKGKGFSEGMKTRASWTDEDALGEYGLPGIIGGIALDIISDPLMYIPPIGIIKLPGKISKVTKVTKAVTEATKASRVGQWFGRNFIYRFGQDPIYKELAERSIKNIATGQQNLLDIVKPLTKLDPTIQKTIAEFRKAGKLVELPKDLLKKVQPAFDALDDLGKQAVEVGLLPNEIWAKNLGKYMPRLYKTKELPIEVGKKIAGIFPTKPKKIDLSRFMKRKDIPDDIRTAMGEILEAGYPTTKGLVQLKAAVENAKMFKEVATKWGSDLLQEGFKKLPDTKRLGGLASKFVPEFIFNDIQEIIRVPSQIEKGLGKVVAGFKFSKVILNPATHARNVISNTLLNWWKLGLGPWRADIYTEAIKQITKGGKWVDEAKTVGYKLNTYAANEIKALLTGPEGIKALGTKGRAIIDKLGDIYQSEENFAKLAAFIYKRKAGMGIEDAWKAAESATFNYAQVTPTIRRIREAIWGFPFITFTYKATPIAIETALKHPVRISALGKIKNAIENMADIKETEKERASEPAWIRDGFYIKLPMKDQYNRSAYFDLTYIIPFGDLISGEYWERRIERETGLEEGVIPGLARKAPLLNVIKELTSNQDFYGNKIWKDGNSLTKQLGDVMRHLMKTYLPPLIADQIPGGYRQYGEKAGERRPGIVGRLKEVQKQIETGGSQGRTLMQEILRNVGLKIQPIDVDIQETYMEWEKKKALQTLLEEAGLLKIFERGYVPK